MDFKKQTEVDSLGFNLLENVSVVTEKEIPSLWNVT